MSKILLAALMAGALSGLFATAVQQMRVIPLILEAETYEKSDEGDNQGHSHSHADEHQKVTAHPQAVHHSGGVLAVKAPVVEIWAPEEGIERTFYTALANILSGTAFAMLLTAAVLLTVQSSLCIAV